ETVMGSMARYITTADPKHFQPMNANFGLVPEWPERIRNKREKNEKLAERALDTIQNFTQKRHN
ncbi:methylenetetrahydrofolate--tRNA-(uracil(54)-C(5))-methyltransferase (FADH(2)-oxidizing) TrmFO, partial [Mesorhizobium sp. M00.F.Ca.ET.186.01.1.1]